MWSGYCGYGTGLGTVWSGQCGYGTGLGTVWSGQCGYGTGLGTMRLILSYYSSGTIFEIPQMELAHPNRAQTQAGREG